MSLLLRVVSNGFGAHTTGSTGKLVVVATSVQRLTSTYTTCAPQTLLRDRREVRGHYREGTITAHPRKAVIRPPKVCLASALRLGRSADYPDRNARDVRRAGVEVGLAVGKSPGFDGNPGLA